MTRACPTSIPMLMALLLSLPAMPAGAQTRQSAPGDELFRKLAALDGELFGAYNSCDQDKFATFFAEDVEFYHDKAGATRGRATLLDSLKKNICGKTRRDLVPGTLEVHPMDGYGALQLGAHRFCDAQAKPCDSTAGGVARFIHLWENRDGSWKITRVISYDHAPAAQ